MTDAHHAHRTLAIHTQQPADYFSVCSSSFGIHTPAHCIAITQHQQQLLRQFAALAVFCIVSRWGSHSRLVSRNKVKNCARTSAIAACGEQRVIAGVLIKCPLLQLFHPNACLVADCQVPPGYYIKVMLLRATAASQSLHSSPCVGYWPGVCMHMHQAAVNSTITF